MSGRARKYRQRGLDNKINLWHIPIVENEFLYNEKGRRVMSTTIGFIGLGIMGKPMARNLLKAGYKLVVYNRNPAPMGELTAEGATAAGSPKVVAEQSDVVITMLPDSPQ